MSKRALTYSYDLHIISNQEDVKKSAAVLSKKRKALELLSRTQIEARSHYDQSTYVLFKQQELFDRDKETYKKGNFTGEVISNWGDMTTLSKFIRQYCDDDYSKLLEIHINKGDVEGLRIASFMASFCIRAKRSFVIRTFDEKNVLTLYEPPINESTRLVLFSIIDYALKHGDFPEFDQLRVHHFSNLQGMGKWESAKDNNYVNSLYASLRTLQRLDLIDKKFHDNMRKMLGIKPTTNGYLAVLFSEVVKRFESSLVAEDNADHQPGDIEDEI